MPAIHLHHVHLLLIAQRSAKRALEDSRRPDALTDDSLLAIVMAATAAEAFINELAEYVLIHRDNASSWLALPPPLITCADVIIRGAKSGRGSLVQKYIRASEALGARFDEDTPPLLDFIELVNVRNAIVHLRSDDERGPTHTASLADRGIALAADWSGLPWLDRLQTPETASWAVRSARNIMLALLELAPTQEGILPEYDFLHGLREAIRDHPEPAA